MDDVEKTVSAAALDPQTASEEHEIEVLLEKHGITRARVEELKSKHRKLYMLIDQPIIIIPMNGDQFDRVGQKPEKERVRALIELAKFLVVHPEPAAYLAMAKETPLLWSTITDVAFDLAKGKSVLEAKKL